MDIDLWRLLMFVTWLAVTCTIFLTVFDGGPTSYGLREVPGMLIGGAVSGTVGGVVASLVGYQVYQWKKRKHLERIHAKGPVLVHCATLVARALKDHAFVERSVDVETIAARFLDRARQRILHNENGIRIEYQDESDVLEFIDGWIKAKARMDEKSITIPTIQPLSPSE
jgi:hypothetical protein